MDVAMEVDCKGLNCPMPIMKIRKAIDSLKKGDVVKLLATDPGCENDVNAWIKRTGNVLLKQEHDGAVQIFYLQKA